MSLRLPPKEYAKLCGEILGRDGFKCRNWNCGFRGNLHVHHIVFRSQGGDDTECNLLTLCSSCHDGVHKAIRTGEPGLTVTVDATTGEVTIKQASWWRPQ